MSKYLSNCSLLVKTGIGAKHDVYVLSLHSNWANQRGIVVWWTCFGSVVGNDSLFGFPRFYHSTAFRYWFFSSVCAAVCCSHLSFLLGLDIQKWVRGYIHQDDTFERERLLVYRLPTSWPLNCNCLSVIVNTSHFGLNWLFLSFPVWQRKMNLSIASFQQSVDQGCHKQLKSKGKPKS